MAERGEPGEEKTLLLELRLIADVGIVGVPNAGKSTLLAAVTNAKPKIAEYPFTTLQPNLGVADLDDLTSVILADIPGLIEGAHKGTGLGFAFLRHIERTRVLIHVIDGSSENPIADFSQVNAEMALFSPGIAQKPQIVAINKIDLPDVEERLSTLTEMISERGYESFPISAIAHRGLRELLWSAHERLSQLEPQPVVEDTLPVYRFEEETIPFEISREPDGAWRVSGEEVERAAAMTYWEFDEAIARFQRLLVHLGVEDALREAGITSGETVRISDYELEWLT
jgi:GTP-binding protein